MRRRRWRVGETEGETAAEDETRRALVRLCEIPRSRSDCSGHTERSSRPPESPPLPALPEGPIAGTSGGVGRVRERNRLALSERKGRLTNPPPWPVQASRNDSRILPGGFCLSSRPAAAVLFFGRRRKGQPQERRFRFSCVSRSSRLLHLQEPEDRRAVGSGYPIPGPSRLPKEESREVFFSEPSQGNGRR